MAQSNVQSDALFQKIEMAAPADVKTIATTQSKLLTQYYEEALEQGEQSFRWALFAAVGGFIVLIAAIIFITTNERVEVGVVTLIAGGLIEFIAAVFFYLYGRTALQMADYRERLDQTQRFLLAHSMSETLEGELRDRVRAHLITTIATTAMQPKSLTQ